MMAAPIHISLQVSGGFAFIPGFNNQRYDVTSQQLSPTEQARLTAMIDALNFRERPKPSTGMVPNPDARHYRLTLTKGKHERTIEFSEPLEPELSALVHFVQEVVVPSE